MHHQQVAHSFNVHCLPWCVPSKPTANSCLLSPDCRELQQWWNMAALQPPAVRYLWILHEEWGMPPIALQIKFELQMKTVISLNVSYYSLPFKTAMLSSKLLLYTKGHLRASAMLPLDSALTPGRSRTTQVMLPCSLLIRKGRIHPSVSVILSLSCCFTVHCFLVIFYASTPLFNGFNGYLIL